MITTATNVRKTFKRGNFHENRTTFLGILENEMFIIITTDTFLFNALSDFYEKNKAHDVAQQQRKDVTGYSRVRTYDEYL